MLIKILSINNVIFRTINANNCNTFYCYNTTVIILKKQDKNLISCTSPKIANIFSFQDYVDKAIKKFK